MYFPNHLKNQNELIFILWTACYTNKRAFIFKYFECKTWVCSNYFWHLQAVIYIIKYNTEISNSVISWQLLVSDLKSSFICIVSKNWRQKAHSQFSCFAGHYCIRDENRWEWFPCTSKTVLSHTGNVDLLTFVLCQGVYLLIIALQLHLKTLGFWYCITLLVQFIDFYFFGCRTSRFKKLALNLPWSSW